MPQDGKFKEFEETDKSKNVSEIVVPFEVGSTPEYLRNFVENDPNFYPEIHSQSLQNVFLDLNADSSTSNNIKQEITYIIPPKPKANQFRAFQTLMKLDFDSFLSDRIYQFSIFVILTFQYVNFILSRDKIQYF